MTLVQEELRRYQGATITSKSAARDEINRCLERVATIVTPLMGSLCYDDFRDLQMRLKSSIDLLASEQRVVAMRNSHWRTLIKAPKP